MGWDKHIITKHAGFKQLFFVDFERLSPLEDIGPRPYVQDN